MDSVLATLLILGTPFVAVVGGIVAAILKIRGRQRLAELAQRERIAAIEKGLDLSLLPPAAVPLFDARQAALRRAQGFMIGGLLTLAIGAGLGLTLLLMADHEARASWPIAFIPAFLGIALLISARVVKQGLDRE